MPLPSPWSSRIVVCTLLLVAGCDDGSPRGADGGLDSGTGGEGGTDAGEGDAGSSTLEVLGTIVDAATGLPVVGAAVFVANAPGVVSDLSGRFRVDGVTAPYDVAVRANGDDEVVVYQGLTRTDPRLAVDAPPPMRTADLSGHALVPEPAVASDRLSCFLAGGASLAGFTRVTGASGSSVAWNMSGGGLYDLPARWWGPNSTDGAVDCYLDRFSGGAIVASWHGSLPLTLASGGAFANRDVALVAAPLATVSGTLTDPLGEAEVTLAVGPAVASGDGYYASAGSLAPGSFSRVVPYATGDFLSIVTTDASQSRRAAALVPAAPTVAVDLSLLPRPTLLSPASGATGVTSTAPITFQGGDGHAFVVRLWVEQGPTVRIYTASHEVVPPDVARFGLAYPAGGSARVLVTELDAPTVDSLAETTGVLRWIAQRGTMRSATTPVRAFTLSN